MSIPRAYVSAGLVSVSKPGVNVLSPGAISYDFLSLDSRLDGIRPLFLGTTTLNVGNNVMYGQTFAKPPFVTLIGNADYLVYKDANSRGYFLRTAFFIEHMTDRFIITDEAVYDRPSGLSIGATIGYAVWERLS